MDRRIRGPEGYWQVVTERTDFFFRGLSFCHRLVDVPVDDDVDDGCYDADDCPPPLPSSLPPLLLPPFSLGDYDDAEEDVGISFGVGFVAAGIDETEKVVGVLVGIDVGADAERSDDGAAADGAPDNGAPDAGDGEACGGSAVLAGRGAWPPPPPVSSASLPLT